ncbi:MAG: hypothetical protein ACHQIM_10310 [Sphingobacteriales bacterium]
MQSVSTSPFNLSMLRKHNIWYTIKDGNWSDPTIWIGNGKRKYGVPQMGDDVYVNHSVVMDSNILINNMYISGSLKGTSINAYTITVNGDLQVSGSGLLDLSLQYNNLVLNGYNNIIPSANFNAGNYSKVTYNATTYSQAVLNIPYNNLTALGGQKYQVGDVTVAGTFTQQSNYECGAYSLTVNGSSTIGNLFNGTFSKNSASGSILFVGFVDFEGPVDLSIGNPNIEFRGGFQIHAFNFNIGTGTTTFTTNNQTITCSYFSSIWYSPIVIQGAITVALAGSATFQTNSTINGTVSGSTFNNMGVLYLGNSAAPMTTGIFNYQYTTTSTLGYAFNGSGTLPYGSYANLVISGTGTKSLGANTSVNRSLTITNGILDCAGCNLSVSTTFTCNGDFRATSFSNILFIGAAFFGSGVTTGFDLRTGNANVEFRAGLEVHASSCYTGTGIFSFTTNSQTLNFSAFNGGVCNCNILVSGAISLLFLGNTAAPGIVTGVVNGDNTSSIFNNGGTFQYNNSQQPMQTGKLYCNQAANTFIYGLSGNQDITPPSDSLPGYKNLTLNGSGTKKLLGNVSVKGTYSLLPPATLDSNGFALTNP